MIASAVMACLMLTSTASYAETTKADTSETVQSKTYTVYDDAGNEYVLNEDEVLGVLYDKDGNVKEHSIISTYAIYVDGKKYTLEPGDYFITYQYEVKHSFYAGFRHYYKDGNQPSTTPGGLLRISLYDCDTIGGTRKCVKTKFFSTTYNSMDVNENENEFVKSLDTNLKTSSRPYYNARFDNAGSKTITVCWFVGKD